MRFYNISAIIAIDIKDIDMYIMEYEPDRREEI